MDDERDHFYKPYREARTEVDQASREMFEQLWKSEGSKILEPWASRSGVNVFNIYLCPVMKRNGRGVPINQEQRVLFHVVAPLPETKAESLQSLLVVLHETTHRLTDRLVDSTATIPERQKIVSRENAAFYADHIFLKSRFPQRHEAYLKFFLSLDQASLPGAAVEKEFLKSYPVDASLQSALDQLVKSLY